MASARLPVVFPPIKKPDPPPTEEQLRISAETGRLKAVIAYADFLPQPKDFPWYLKAAEAGDVVAMVELANRYANGTGGAAKNLTISEHWKQKANEGTKKALDEKDANMLGRMLTENSGDLPFNDPLRTEYALASGRAGGFEIGDIASLVISGFPAGPEKARLLQKCSDDGHLWCTDALANDYLKGSDALPDDHSRVIALFEKVAEAGYTAPNPQRVVVDDATRPNEQLAQSEMIPLWKTAIEHGYIEAVDELSQAYCDGNGVQKSGLIAQGLLREGIAHETDTFEKAQMIALLASMHVEGRCFPANLELFLQAYSFASSGDSELRRNVVEAALVWGNSLGSREFSTPANSAAAGRATVSLLRLVVENSHPFSGAANFGERKFASEILGDLYSDGKFAKQSYPDALSWYQRAVSIAADPAAAHDENPTDSGSAENKIGVMYELGRGVARDPSAAMAWYEKAVAHKNAWGEYNLANLLMGTPTKGNVSRAIPLIRASAEAGNANAQNWLGNLLLNGTDLPRNDNEAVSWYQKSADQGFAWALLNLGRRYQDGRGGVERNPAKAVDLYQKAAEKGNINAVKQLAEMYYVGDGVPKDLAKAFPYYKKAADADDPWGEESLGYFYQNGVAVQKDPVAAISWYQRAAAHNSASAEVALANIYRDGQGVAQNLAAAKALYAKAAAADNAEAQLNLADFVNADSDPSAAAQWYKKAADHGNARAQFSYGYLVEHGQGIAQNDFAAAQYYQLAANQGFAAAENNLGMMYERGRGVNKDEQRALQLFQSGSAHGNSGAAQNAHQLGAILEQQRQIAEAKAAADQAEQEQAERERKIADIRSDLQAQEQSAEQWDRIANDIANGNSNNCSGPTAGICQAIGNVGSAKARQNANKARNQADRDREEIERLEGVEVENRQRRDTSYMGNLAQTMNENPGPTIEDTLAQQQAQLNAMAVATQQRQAATAQANLDKVAANRQGQSPTLQSSIPRPTSPSSTSAPQTASTIAPVASTISTSTPKPQQGCTVMNKWLRGSARVERDGFVTGHLTNTSTQALYVSWSFKKNGVAAGNMADAGGGVINPGQTVGGEGGGIWSTDADKNPPEIYWYAVLKSDEDAGKTCSHKQW